jgi:hypothetical protein
VRTGSPGAHHRDGAVNRDGVSMMLAGGTIRGLRLTVQRPASRPELEHPRRPALIVRRRPVSRIPHDHSIARERQLQTEASDIGDRRGELRLERQLGPRLAQHRSARGFRLRHAPERGDHPIATRQPDRRLTR